MIPPPPQSPGHQEVTKSQNECPFHRSLARTPGLDTPTPETGQMLQEAGHTLLSSVRGYSLQPCTPLGGKIKNRPKAANAGLTLPGVAYVPQGPRLTLTRLLSCCFARGILTSAPPKAPPQPAGSCPTTHSGEPQNPATTGSNYSPRLRGQGQSDADSWAWSPPPPQPPACLREPSG